MKVSFLNRQKEKLAGVLEGTGTKGVIFSHGFTGNKDEWGRFLKATLVVAKDFRVLRFDFSGNGESEGKFEESHFSKETDDLLSAIAFMKEQGCTSIGLYGHSMGGAVSILAAAREKVQAVATSAAVVYPNPARMAKFAREWVNKELPTEFLENVANTNVLQAVSKINAPLLIMHGDRDTIIPVEEARQLYAHAKEPKKLVIINGADHDFEGQVEQLAKEMAEWMKKYL